MIIDGINLEFHTGDNTLFRNALKFSKMHIRNLFKLLNSEVSIGVPGLKIKNSYSYH